MKTTVMSAIGAWVLVLALGINVFAASVEPTGAPAKAAATAPVTVPAWEYLLDAKLELLSIDNEAALDSARRAVETEPGKSEGYELQVYLHLMTREPDASRLDAASAVLTSADAAVSGAKGLVPAKALLALRKGDDLALVGLADAAKPGDEDGDMALAALAVRQFGASRFEDFARTTEKSLSGWPGRPLPLLLETLRLGHAREYRKAGDSLERAIVLLTNPVFRRSVFLQILQIDPLIVDQAKAFESAVLSGQGTADQTWFYGLLSFYLGNFEEARNAFQTLAELEPQNPKPTLYQGVFNVMLGEFDRSIEHLNRYLTSFPDDVRGLKVLGGVQSLKKDYAAAEKTLTRVTQLAPKDPEALSNLGVVTLALGRAAEARKLYERAMEASPDYGEAWRNLGVMLGRDRNYPEAKSYFVRAAQLNPADSEACRYLGLISLEEGDLTSARRWLLRARALAPSDPNVLLNLAVCEKELGNTDQAVGILEMATQMIPKNAALRRELGRMLLDRKSPARAVQQLRESLKLDPSNEEAKSLLEQARKQADTGTATKVKVKYLVFYNVKAAQDALLMLEQGKTFADLEASASAKGVTEIERGQFIAEVEDVAFLLKSGETSSLIPTPRGFFVIQRH